MQLISVIRMSSQNDHNDLQ